MKALIITAHGSRLDESNKEVATLAEEVEALAEDHFDFVRCAFLQFTHPQFGTVVAGLAAEGVTQIVVFPYFIAAGSHVSRDIPTLIEKAARENPGIEFALTPHLGSVKGMKGFILEEVVQHIP